jgi:hypothetical protein
MFEFLRLIDSSFRVFPREFKSYQSRIVIC